MPGIGTAPPTTGIARSPLQLPSALQGLAKMFQGGQQQPKPASKFPPVKPPALTEEQASQPPQHVGKPASFAPVPATVPVETGGFTPYIKAQDARDPSKWGDPVYYPRLPATFELGGIFNQIGQTLAQAGGGVGEAGGQLAYHSAEYWKGFNAQQDHMMKMAKEGQALAAAQAADRLTNRLIDYRNTFSEYAAAGGENAVINGVDLRHALYDDAIRDDDKQAQALLTSGAPLKQVEAYLAEADKTLRDLQAARTKASEQDDTDAQYGLAPNKGNAFNADPRSQTAPTAPEAPIGAPPAPAPVPAPAPDANAPPSDVKDQKPPDDVPDAIKALGPEYQNPNLVNAGTQIYQGVAPGSEMSKNATHHARVISDALGVETGKILADPNLKPGQYMDAVRKRLGSLPAADLQSIEDYTNPDMISGTGYGKQSEYLKQLQNIAAKDMPGDASGRGAFNAANFSLQKQFKEGQVQTVLTRTGDMASTLRNVHSDLDRLQKEAKAQGYGPNDIDLDALLKSVTGQGVANRVRSDLEAYAAAYDYIVTSGHSTLGGREAFEKYFNIYMPISTIRDTIKGHVPSTEGILQGVHARWEGIGGKPTNMPGIRPETEKEIHDYGKQDIVTGALPYDPSRDNDIFLKPKGKWGPAGRYYWTGESDERDDPRNWKRAE